MLREEPTYATALTETDGVAYTLVSYSRQSYPRPRAPFYFSILFLLFFHVPVRRHFIYLFLIKTKNDTSRNPLLLLQPLDFSLLVCAHHPSLTHFKVAFFPERLLSPHLGHCVCVFLFLCFSERVYLVVADCVWLEVSLFFRGKVQMQEVLLNY